MGRIKITDNEQTITNDVFIDLAYQEEISVAKHILQIDPDYIKLLGFIPTRIRKQINSDIDVRLEDATCTEGIPLKMDSNASTSSITVPSIKAPPHTTSKEQRIWRLLCFPRK